MKVWGPSHWTTGEFPGRENILMDLSRFAVLVFIARSMICNKLIFVNDKIGVKGHFSFTHIVVSVSYRKDFPFVLISLLCCSC